MTTEKSLSRGKPHSPLHAAPALAAAGGAMAVAIPLALGGCALEPQGPTPISRLSADQSGVAIAAPPMTPQARERYEAINRQVLADQNQAIAREATADALARAYATPRVSLYGGYFGGWGGGPNWSVGFGNPGFGPGWGPGWGSRWGPGWNRRGWHGGTGWGVNSGFAGWGWGGGGMGWGMGWGF
ncbi:MAG TPA: hypothetical protein VGG24_09835 [Paraburkholderia sp.]